MEPKDKRSATEIFQQVWGQALVAVTGAEEEATRLLARFQEMAGWAPDEAKRQVRAFADRLATQRREVERQLEETVHHTVQRVRVPRRDEVAQLNTRLDALVKRMEALSK